MTAVADLDLQLGPGETVGLVGASGAGKSTIARLAVGLERPDEGRVLLAEEDLTALDRRTIGRQIHLVFQDPYAALAPHLSVAEGVSEPLDIHGEPADRDRLVEALEEVQLTPGSGFLDRYPHELSGGERQRVALARALILRPPVVVADEPTQLLDPSTRADLIRLMADLRDRHGMAFLYVTHDLALAQEFCGRLAVLHEGRIVEEGPTDELIDRPRSMPARDLVAAVRSLQAGLSP